MVTDIRSRCISVALSVLMAATCFGVLPFFSGVGADMNAYAATSFEQDLIDQGFPKTYRSRLIKLHKAHPKWVFKARHTDVKWSTALAKQTKVGRNLVASSAKNSWKSFKSGAYNFNKKKFVVFDGKWNDAANAVTAHYMDPRNFLNETGIYQFMDHGFDAKSQTKETIKSLVGKYDYCFMNTTGYVNKLYNAGKDSKVNPNVIAAMVIMEQGWRGGSALISGKYKGYEGIYNHFNVGAYTTSSMSSTVRGLWFAKGSGINATTYNRPWTTIRKSLAGGAMFFASNYTTKNQNTLYTKKFNVANGKNLMGSHQYMTNVSGAASEGTILSYAYEKSPDYPIVFHIPVYKSMPGELCPKPVANSKMNNNLLDSITITNATDNTKITGWKFKRYTRKYDISLPSGVKNINISAKTNNKNATLEGTGTFAVNKTKTVTLTVKAPTGILRTYTLNLTTQ